ncbi:MAG TPA: hypothetical protein VD994_18710, partial [Prosthecobacter sp.]|nr:hypothetical protein [Prosthecobacter sp.]
FTSAATSTAADQFRIWRGDASPGAVTYRNFFYFSSGSTATWVDAADPGTDRTGEDLFLPGRAFILSPGTPKPARVVECPWVP